MRRRGQSAIEYLTTYGWAFLMILAAIAGLVALDPLGITSDSATCETSGALRCDTTKTQMSDSALSVEVENPGTESIVVSDPGTETVNDQSDNTSCTTESSLLRPDESTTITCKSLDLVEGEQNTARITYDQYEARSGGEYARQQTVQVGREPNPSSTITPSGSETAPSNLSSVISSMSGSGTPSSPYIITNVSELQAMTADPDAHYKLGNDIAASSASEWNNGSGFIPVPGSGLFEGEFDGDGKTISGLPINRSGSSFVGLFTLLSADSKVFDVTLSGVDIKASQYVGGLAGINLGLVRDSKVTGEVTGEDTVGGVVGLADGAAGGFTSLPYTQNSTMKRITATVDVTHTQGYGGGGIAGMANGGTYEELTANGFVTYTGSPSYAASGGIVGYVDDNSQFIRNTADVTVNAQGNNTGGLVGMLDIGDVEKSYAVGDVTGQNKVGGLVGRSDNAGGEVQQSYATGDVTGNQNVGGLVGQNEEYADIHYAYATGNVTGSSNVGGVVGKSSGPGPIEALYWDEESTGQSTDATSNSTGLQTAEMQGSSATGNMSQFDFTTTWDTTSGYPELAWE